MVTFTVNANDKTQFEVTATGSCKESASNFFHEKAGAWEVRFGIAVTNGIINDNFAYVVGLRHNQAPHGEPQGDVLITGLIIVDADDYSEGSHSLTPTAIAIKHQDHYDVLNISGIFTVSTTLNFDSITSFNIDVSITHSESLPRGAELVESSPGSAMDF